MSRKAFPGTRSSASIFKTGKSVCIIFQVSEPTLELTLPRLDSSELTFRLKLVSLTLDHIVSDVEVMLDKASTTGMDDPAGEQSLQLFRTKLHHVHVMLSHRSLAAARWSLDSDIDVRLVLDRVV
jgi:hypothetical protein